MNSMAYKNENSPPRPRMAIRVGVTGHRAVGLSDVDKSKLIHQIESVLNTVEDVVNKIQADEANSYSDESPIFCIVSPLAEGADRIVARVGLKNNFELQCPLPFFREVYEMDFKGTDSIREYHALLDCASAVIELDGSYETNETRKEAYEAVGRMVSKQSDLLIAIWDGDESGGRGGTGQIVKESLERGLSVIWIDSKPPHFINLLVCGNHGIKELSFSTLANILDPILRFESPYEAISWQVYLQEKAKRLGLLNLFYTVFRNLLADGNPGKLNSHARSPVKLKKCKWEKDWDGVPDFPQNIREEIEERLLPHQAWADYLAIHYGDKYRGSFLVNYILAGFAVFFALFAYALGWTNIDHPNYHIQWVWTLTEIAIVIAILINIYQATSGRWHLKWLTYRLLAERLRLMRFLYPLGMSLPMIRLPGHKKICADQTRYSWGNRLFFAVIRGTGLPNARLEQDYLKSCWRFMKEIEIKSQINYHIENSKRFHRLSHHLHIISHGLFWLTLFAAIMHLIYHGPYSEWFVFITAVAPAFGAAVYGITSQGEFERIADQSSAMSMHLETVLENMNNIRDLVSTANLEKLFDSISEIMLSELVDWDLLYREKRLTLPT